MNTLRSLLKKYVLATIAIFAMAVVITYFTTTTPRNESTLAQEQYQNNEAEGDYTDPELAAAIEAGRKLHAGNCTGTGPVELTHGPMDMEDVSNIEPYGLMIGAHVTPIDHQYFAPADYNSPRDSYEVYAMANGKIVNIQHRVSNENTGQHITDEYRIVFAHTCTVLTYYDLVTSLTPEIKAEFDENESNNYANVNIEVEAGQLIGWIGGQTLDFAVWDTEKPLTGFVNLDSYNAEAWKLYTANPFDYYTEELTDLLWPKYLRDEEPIAGQIDYDIDGKLVGTWFVEGTNGYQGEPPEYWSTHMSIVYHHLDPERIILSIGNFNGESKQFAIVGNTPDPATIGPEDGAVRYNLVEFDFQTQNGEHWDRITPTKNITVVETTQRHGSILFQMVGDRKLKVEVFPNADETIELSFTENAVIYER